MAVSHADLLDRGEEGDEVSEIFISVVSYLGAKDVRALVESVERHTASSLTKRSYIVDNANEPEVF